MNVFTRIWGRMVNQFWKEVPRQLSNGSITKTYSLRKLIQKCNYTGTKNATIL